jgi:hypothetical protein
MKKCPECGDELIGRIDKKFCSPYCKSSYHYKIARDDDKNQFKKIDDQLKLNRRLLKEHNKAGKAVVRTEVLLNLGFNPKYFTHYWKNDKKEVYLFCYEFGFLTKKENGYSKYVLVQWQSYMNK